MIFLWFTSKGDQELQREKKKNLIEIAAYSYWILLQSL